MNWNGVLRHNDATFMEFDKEEKKQKQNKRNSDDRTKAQQFYCACSVLNVASGCRRRPYPYKGSVTLKGIQIRRLPILNVYVCRIQ